MVFESASELSRDAWDTAERFWLKELARLEVDAGQVGEWPSWEPRTYGDGVTPMPREYGSICEGRSYRLDRAFLQHAPTDNDLSIGAWVNDYEHDELWSEHDASRLPRAILVINLALTEETARIARSLLRQWMAPDTIANAMQAFIDEILSAHSADTDDGSGTK